MELKELIGKKLETLKGLRKSLNPVSRFDFGTLQGRGSRTGLAGERTRRDVMRLFEHPDFKQAILQADPLLKAGDVAGCVWSLTLPC